MKKTVLCILLFLVVNSPLFSQSEMEVEKEAVKQAALDYIDGAHEGNAERMERAVHAELNKITLRKLPNSEKTVLFKAGSSRLIELIRANVAPLEKEKRNIKVTIYTIKEGLACVKVVSAMFYDYLLLAKIDVQWKIVNILWKNNSADNQTGDPDKEKEAIKKTAMNYIEGAYSGDAGRMAEAVHPQLNKVIPMTLPQTGKTAINYSSAELLIEGTRAKMGMLEAGKRNIKVTIFDVREDIAMVEVLSTMYYDYLQLAKLDGQWKIVNVLWKMNPDAPRPNRE